MFCSQCGYKLVEGGVFCPGCGTEIKTSPKRVVEQPSENGFVTTFETPIAEKEVEINIPDETFGEVQMDKSEQIGQGVQMEGEQIGKEVASPEASMTEEQERGNPYPLQVKRLSEKEPRPFFGLPALIFSIVLIAILAIGCGVFAGLFFNAIG